MVYSGKRCLWGLLLEEESRLVTLGRVENLRLVYSISLVYLSVCIKHSASNATGGAAGDSDNPY